MDIKIISGLFNNIKGPGKSHTGFLYLDVSVNELSNINLKINDDWNSFIYVYEGGNNYLI